MVSDPYGILGVGRGAGAGEIKAAYRALAKRYHPDLHPGDPYCARKMNEINAAYDQLKSPTKPRGAQSASQQAGYRQTGYRQAPGDGSAWRGADAGPFGAAYRFYGPYEDRFYRPYGSRRGSAGGKSAGLPRFGPGRALVIAIVLYFLIRFFALLWGASPVLSREPAEETAGGRYAYGYQVPPAEEGGAQSRNNGQFG